MKAYISPKAKTLPFCAESLLAASGKTVELDEDEDVSDSDKSNRRAFLWDE